MFYINWDGVPKLDSRVIEVSFDHNDYQITTHTKYKRDINLIMGPLCNLDVNGKGEDYESLTVRKKSIPNESKNLVFEFRWIERSLILIKGPSYNDDLLKSFSLMHLLGREQMGLNWFKGSQFFERFNTDIHRWKQTRIHWITAFDNLNPYPCIIVCKDQGMGEYLMKIECLVSGLQLKPRFDDPASLMWKDFLEEIYKADRKFDDEYCFKEFREETKAMLGGKNIPFIIDRGENTKIDTYGPHMFKNTKQPIKINDKHKYGFVIKTKDGMRSYSSKPFVTDIESEQVNGTQNIRFTTEFRVPIDYLYPDYYTSLALAVMKNALRAYLPQKS